MNKLALIFIMATLGSFTIQASQNIPSNNVHEGHKKIGQTIGRAVMGVGSIVMGVGVYRFGKLLPLNICYHHLKRDILRGPYYYGPLKNLVACCHLHHVLPPLNRNNTRIFLAGAGITAFSSYSLQKSKSKNN